jgi:hypothetical protein
VVEVKTYQAIASRGDRYWVVRVVGVGNDPERGLPTQARTLAEVESMARDLVAVWLEVPEDSFGIEVVVELPHQVRAHLDRAEELRQLAARVQSEAADEYRSAANDLKYRFHLTVRDIGKSLDVSYQRAQQLVSQVRGRDVVRNKEGKPIAVLLPADDAMGQTGLR